MGKVKPVPDGYHTVSAVLTLQGADRAIELYRKAFGAEELFRMPGPDGKVMHAELQIGDSRVMISEAIQRPPTVSTLHLYVPDVDTFYQRAVSAGCKASMPLANMFWGDRYGHVTDPFGITWSLATHIEDVSPAEMQKRMAAMPKQQ
jgi:PhnB protein